MPLPPCHSRRPLNDETDRFRCAHPRVHVDGNIVSSDFCRLCTLWSEPEPAQFRHLEQSDESTASEPRCAFLGNAVGWHTCPTCRGNVKLRMYDCRHPWHDTTTLRECRACTEFQQREEDRHVAQWSVGMTTAPREVPTLGRSLASLRDAGWERPHLFVEPHVEIPSEFESLPMSRRHTTLGPFPNWYLALTEMFFADPGADAYFLCQDDVLFSRGVRDYLETSLWPAPEIGVVSIYCPSHYALRGPQGFCVEDQGAGAWGALAYIFSNPSVQKFLTHRLPVDHRHHGRQHGLHRIDGIVGAWCRDAGLPYYVHNPSLAQHIGDTSTMGSGPNIGGRRADRFLEDARPLLAEISLASRLDRQSNEVSVGWPGLDQREAPANGNSG
jgi:hypothetical protein